MSSSSRKRAGLTAAGVTALTVGTTAGAAEIYYQPVVSVTTQYNNNLNLDPTEAKIGAEGYFADALANIGIATPRSDTQLQPRLVYNYYPSVSQRDLLEGFLSLNHRYSGQRDRFTLAGFYDHRDDVNAEQPGAEQNVVTGTGDNTATTGRPALGVKRDYVILDPSYSHLLSPLSSIGVSAQYQRMSYNVEDQSSHIGFSFYQANAFFAHNITPRLDFSVGVLGSRYNASSIDANATTEGLHLTSGYDWTQVLHSEVTADYQHVKFEETSPHVIDANNNAWAATFSTVYKEQTSSYRFIIGRTIYPSSAGGLYTIDQVRGQYDRDLTQRLHFMGALRYFREGTTVGSQGNDKRKYASGIVRLQYMMTRTFFVAGFYQANYQKYSVDANSADSNIVGITFGYAGLQRQR